MIKQCIFCGLKFKTCKWYQTFCSQVCYRRNKIAITAKKVCKIKGCKFKPNALEMCSSHWHRFKRYGNPEEPLKQAKAGSGTLNDSGYKLITINGNQVREHRYIMEQHLGRKLMEREQVHHKNHIRTDNRLSNLEIVDISEHTRLHLKERYSKPRMWCQKHRLDKCVFCGTSEIRHWVHGHCARCARFISRLILGRSDYKKRR